MQVSFAESIITEVGAVTMGAPINMRNMFPPSYKVFMGRAKMRLEKFPIYRLLSHHQKRIVMESHINCSVPLIICHMETCLTFLDQMQIAFNQDEIDYFKQLRPEILAGAMATPAMTLNSKSHNCSTEDFNMFFPEEHKAVYFSCITMIENVRKQLKADKDMLDVCLILHSVGQVTKKIDQKSDIRKYINNLKQLMLRKIGLLHGGVQDMESIYNEAISQLEKSLEPLADLYSIATSSEKYFILQNDTDFEVCLPKL